MSRIPNFNLLIAWIGVICGVIEPAQSKGCLGTSNGLSHQGSADSRYRALRVMYTNCTYVEGNLEIIFLDGQPDYDLSFLSDIEEISGYMLIFASYASYIPLTSLRIIRGTNVFKAERDPKPYSLYIANNYEQSNRNIGLKELRFTSLNEILSGNVFLYNNNELCFENTIYWDDILSGEGADFTYHHDSEDDRRHCEECDVSCHYNKTNSRHCWGEGPGMCQRLNRAICSPQCDGRCYGYTPQDCCHRECAGGCSGPLPTDCWACLHFDNSGRCEAYCPPEMIYNPQTFQMEPNPHVKYAYGSKCVEECPDHLVQSNGACIQDCGHGMMIRDKKCVKCEGPCPKSCIIDEPIMSTHIRNLTECTVIKGSIIIFQHSFDGDATYGIPPMDPSELSVLESVKEVTGYVKIQGKHDKFKDLAFLRNLRLIQGRQLDEYKASLHAVGTSLEAINLHSLESISNGAVLFYNNRHLCYADLINWRSILSEGTNPMVTSNAEKTWCEQNGHQCYGECSSDGCWGPGNSNCLRCENYSIEDTKICLADCGIVSGLYEAGTGAKVCKECNVECTGGCRGAGAGNCTECKNVKDGPYCKNKCPESKYPDETSICQSCHPNCEHNCTGPRNMLGKGGCNQCALAMVDEHGNVTECLPKEMDCPDGFYKIRATEGPMRNKQVCLPCHEECKRCSTDSIAIGFCYECVHYEQEGKCVTNCSSHHYADNLASRCIPCHSTCTECHGPQPSDCFDCKYFKVYWDTLNIEKNPRFNCTDKCTDDYPVKLPDFGDDTETVCVSEPIFAKLTGPKRSTIGLIVGVCVGGVLLVGIVAVIFGYFWKQRAKSEENKLRLTARMSGLEESEPLTPTEAKPDMATLRLIKESELRRGNIIGSGAFGTVYKGFWIPEGETVKIPVAIKVLQEGTSPSQNKELLEEARIMASVYHPCCIRILAVCMTTQMMLVTQLMPLGCLLEYARKNKMNIGSKVLLNWCTQIARGMSYLEERGIVHRDLAARNVLVQSPGQVKITDFGLAKLLDFNEDEFHASGGKMPIKWLALECIQHRIFTHKSDVWSFGVTMWELFTYGQRPYESVRARDIPDLLEKGERLPQPSICTIDVYMIMIKCWMLDADSRPSFKELADEFAKMARDPGRYLVIHGDKLMRLPSHNQDTRDILRNMSIASDTPDFNIIEAHDYLQPRGVTIEPPMTPSLHGSVNGKLERIREDSKDSSTYDDRHNTTTNTSLSTSAGSREGSGERDYPVSAGGGGGRREKKYSGLEAAAAARRQRETAPNGRDSLSSRYCSDPCKNQPDPWDKPPEAGFYPDMPAPPTPIEGKPPMVLDVRLPVDENDYLQPKSTNPRAYMDLVDGPDYSDENSNPPTSDSGYASKQDPMPPPLSPYLDMSAAVQTAIDNPEYYERSAADNHAFPNINIDNVKGEKKPHQIHNNVDTDYSNPEHNYYNDYGQRGGTTARPPPPPPQTALPSVFLDPRTESMV